MISVVIPAYERVADVLTCLNSLRAYASQPFECLVQDDASPSVSFCAVVPPEVASTERNAANLGFAGNCNAGAQRAHLPIVLFMNQDCYAVEAFSVNWDAAIAREFEDSTVGAVACRLLFPDGSVQSAGGTVDGAMQPVHRCFGWRNLNHPDIAEPRSVTWGTGAALAVRKSVFDQLGGFDTGYRMYWEDADLCWRVREAGYQVRYEPRATFVHSVGSTGGSPHFLASARRFKARWVDTGKVSAEVFGVSARYW